MTKQFYILIFLSFFGLFHSSAVQAQSHNPRYSELSITPERYQVNSGDTLTVAIEQIIAPHWHTYWKNPGDSGAPSRVNWQLPEGWSVSEIQWPVPQKIPYGPLLNYGYSNYTALLQDLHVPQNYDGSPVELKATVEVLVCQDICIPEYDDFTLTLNDPAQLRHNDTNTPLIETARGTLPVVVDFDAHYSTTGDQFTLSITLPEGFDLDTTQNAHFIPEPWGIIDNAAPVAFEIDGQQLNLTQKRADRELTDIESLPAVLALSTDKGDQYYAIEAFPKIAIAQSSQGALTPSVLVLLFSAFIGGLILNLMPCVFPVLSLKALSLVKMSQKASSHAKAHGLAYTTGIVLSFLLIASLLMILRQSGAEIGWGYQLQNPVVVSVLTYILFIVGLNLAGIFELHNPFANIGSKATANSGISGSFFTGVLATIVATPCTAPFMATAVGVAFTQPAPIALSIFVALGLGLASPFLVLSFLPHLQRFLPKPGAWMKTLQQFMAFPMFLAVIFLLWVLTQQVGDMQLLSVMAGMIAIAFGIWVWPKAKLWGKIIAFLALVSAGFALPLAAHKIDAGACYYQDTKNLTFGEEFSQPTLDHYLDKTDQPVFVEMTAAWCITCKINHAAAIDVQATRNLFAEKNVAFLVGDWTNQDNTISRYLQKFQRNGVPLYVLYPAPKNGTRPEPVILPQVLTPGTLETYIEKH